MLPKPYLSPSQISMFQRCGKQYEFRYVEGLKIATTAQMALGSSYHKGNEVNMTQKADSQIDMPIEQVRDVFADDWERRIEEVEFKEEEKPGELKDIGIHLLEEYHTNFAPEIFPKDKDSIEQEIDVAFDGVDWKLKTILDLITRENKIIDHKTAAKSWSQSQADNDMAVPAYIIAKSQLEGDSYDFEFHVAVKTKTPKIQIIKTGRTQQELNWYLEMICGVAEAISKGVFAPNPNGWWCGENYCGFWKLCRGKG